MFCRKCGKELRDNAAFCGSCGNPVNKTREVSVSGIRRSPVNDPGRVKQTDYGLKKKLSLWNVHKVKNPELHGGHSNWTYWLFGLLTIFLAWPVGLIVFLIDFKSKSAVRKCQARNLLITAGMGFILMVGFIIQQGNEGKKINLGQTGQTELREPKKGAIPTGIEGVYEAMIPRESGDKVGAIITITKTRSGYFAKWDRFEVGEQPTNFASNLPVAVSGNTVSFPVGNIVWKGKVNKSGLVSDDGIKFDRIEQDIKRTGDGFSFIGINWNDNHQAVTDKSFKSGYVDPVYKNSLHRSIDGSRLTSIIHEEVDNNKFLYLSEISSDNDLEWLHFKGKDGTIVEDAYFYFPYEGEDKIIAYQVVLSPSVKVDTNTGDSQVYQSLVDKYGNPRKTIQYKKCYYTKMWSKPGQTLYYHSNCFGGASLIYVSETNLSNYIASIQAKQNQSKAASKKQQSDSVQKDF